MRQKKSQISTQFAWIFILIAGAIILIFFVSIVYKQKAVSETKLSATVLTQLETILTGAGLSPGTVNIIDTPEIELNLICDETGYSTYFVNKVSGPDNPPQVIFAPDIIKGKKLITWALGFNAPFRVTNFLYLSSPDIKYVLINPSSEVTRSLPEEFTIEITSSISDINTRGFEKIRLVFFDLDPAQIQIPLQLQPKNTDVSAVRISQGTATFYKISADRSRFEQEGTLPCVDMPSLYGAIFAQDFTFYECSMKKAFKRLNLVAKIYAARENALLDYFTNNPNIQDCRLYYYNKTSDVVSHSEQCNQNIRNCISSLIFDIGELENNQINLLRKSCPLIY